MDVRVTELVNDDRGCAPGLSPQDEQVLAVLADGFAYTIESATLTVMGQGSVGLGYTADD
jgi:heat shock protein HslJ